MAICVDLQTCVWSQPFAISMCCCQEVRPTNRNMQIKSYFHIILSVCGELECTVVHTGSPLVALEQRRDLGLRYAV